MRMKRPIALLSLCSNISTSMFTIILGTAFLGAVFGYITALHGYQALVGTAALMLTALVWLKPVIGFVGFWFSIFIAGPGFSTGIMAGPFHINLMDIFLALFIACWLTKAAMQRALLLRVPSLTNVTLLVFLIIALFIGMYQNPFLLIAKDLRPFLYIILTWWLTSAVISDHQNSKNIGKVFAYVIAAGSIGAICKAIMVIAGLIPDDYPSEISQVMISFSKELGGERLFLVGADTLGTIGIPFLTAFIVSRKHLKRWWFLFAGLGCTMLILILSFIRATWIGVTLGLMTVMWLYWHSHKTYGRVRKLMAVLLLVAVLLLIGSNVILGDAEFPITVLIMRRLSGNYELGGGLYGLWRFRVEEARELLKSWEERPLFGKGLGGTYKYLLFPAGVWDYQQWSHNGWLWLLLKGGLIGLALFLLPFLRLAIRGLQLLRTGDCGDNEPVIIGLLSAGLAFSVMSITNNRLASPEGGAFLGLWLGLMSHATSIKVGYE